MGQPLVPHSGYRQRQAKLFNYVKTQGTALSSFFESHWHKPRADLSPTNQEFVLHMAGSRLRALGMLSVARKPLALSLDMAVRRAAWKEAAICGRHCSEVSLLLGDIEEAVQLAPTQA